MSVPSVPASHLTPSEEALVRQQCEALGLGFVLPLGRLTEGRSGSLVVRLRISAGVVVLKVTTDPDRLTRARRECALIADASHGLERVVPDFVAGASDGNAVSLVLREHQPLPPPAELDDARWCDLANSLASMHRAAEAEPPDGLPTRSALDETALAEAARAWRERGEEELAVLGMTRLQEEANTALGVAVSTTLEHGDCHTENIVQDDSGRYRWIDWQEAHLGTGLADLVFLWQRAEFAGAAPPRRAMTRVYAGARSLSTSDLTAALNATELRMLFVAWPPFLSLGSPDAQRMMTSRLRCLLTTSPTEGGPA